MITATYFGEITELGSRAVWYSDEEDSDDESEDKTDQRKAPKQIRPIDHEMFRSNTKVTFRRTLTETNIPFDSCIISLSSSSWQFKNLKIDDVNVQMIGYFDSIGKAFAIKTNNKKTERESDTFLLWLVFDSAHQYIVGEEVGYFVEALREELHSQFSTIGMNSMPILILSRQFSDNECLEYITNCEIAVKSPFVGRPLLPPSLIKNQFESALFEQLTLSLKPAILVCLPDPRNFWFDRIKSWPSVSEHVINHRLNDDSLEKTLIFT